MKQKNKAVTIKDLECTRCGHVQTIQRREGRNRKDGHIKHLWCLVCQERVEHVELPKCCIRRDDATRT